MACLRRVIRDNILTIEHFKRPNFIKIVIISIEKKFVILSFIAMATTPKSRKKN